MSRRKRLTSLLPQGFLWRLSVLNIMVVASAIILSGLAVYNTACFLVDAMGDLGDRQQRQFNATLFNYLVIFSITTIVAGSLLHFYLTKKLITPIRSLIESTKQLKEGDYPKPVSETGQGEVGELSAQFNDLIHQLEANDARRHKLVSDLSHELRTPLTNLNGYLGLLKNGDIEGDQALYQDLHAESRRLTQMMEQIDLLKSWGDVSSRPYVRNTETDMGRLINQCSAMFHWKLEQKNIPDIDVAADTHVISVHAEGIQQVISNLIENAIQYYRGDVVICVTGELKDSVYRVSVSGPSDSIPEQEQENIFERFYRIDDSRSRDTGGSGLGLAIAKEIVERHNGDIGLKVDGDINIFWFDLPTNNQNTSK